MTLRSHAFAILSIIIFAVAWSQDYDPEPDPYCLRGLCEQNACCPAICGQCGGSGCHRRQRELGRACCFNFITRRLGRNCDSEGPPCEVQTPKVCGQTPIDFTTPRWTGPGQWTNITSQINGKPRARHENCFVMANGRGYLIGGRGNRPVNEFNPVTNKWRQVASMPTQMHHMQCVTYNNDVYVASSWFGGFPTESNNENLWIFRTSTYTWESKPGLPEPRRRGGAAQVLFNDRIYVLGGNRGGHGPPSISLGWVDYYDLLTEQWVTNLTSLPDEEERDHVGGARVHDKICIAGGRNGGMENAFAATVASTFCYDPVGDTWENMNADIPTPRAGAATERSCDGRLLVVGGEGPGSGAFDEMEAFDGTSWETLAVIRRERHGTGLAVADCRFCEHIFITAGSGARGGRPELDSTELYVPEGRAPTCDRY